MSAWAACGDPIVRAQTCLAAALLILMAGSVLAHSKTDVIVLENGSSIKGEIKGLLAEEQTHDLHVSMPLDEHGQFPVGPALDKPLEAAELHDVEAGPLDLTRFVEQNGDFSVPFYAGDRLDGDFFQIACRCHIVYLLTLFISRT